MTRMWICDHRYKERLYTQSGCDLLKEWEQLQGNRGAFITSEPLLPWSGASPPVEACGIHSSRIPAWNSHVFTHIFGLVRPRTVNPTLHPSPHTLHKYKGFTSSVSTQEIHQFQSMQTIPLSEHLGHNTGPAASKPGKKQKWHFYVLKHRRQPTHIQFFAPPDNCMSVRQQWTTLKVFRGIETQLCQSSWRTVELWNSYQWEWYTHRCVAG